LGDADGGRGQGVRARIRGPRRQLRVPALLQGLGLGAEELGRRLADRLLALVDGVAAREHRLIEAAVVERDRLANGRVPGALDDGPDVRAAGGGLRAAGFPEARAGRARAPADRGERVVVAVPAGLVRTAAGARDAEPELRHEDAERGLRLRLARADLRRGEL